MATANSARFNDAVAQIISEAMAEARNQKHRISTPDHVLAAMLKDGGYAAAILRRLDIDPKKVSQALDERFRQLPKRRETDQIESDPSMRDLFNRADRESRTLNAEFVAPEHVFLALCTPTKDGNVAGDALAKVGVTRDKVLAAVKSKKIRPPAIQNPAEAFKETLKYARNLTALAANGDLDPVIGRDDTISLVMEVLIRRKRNNPIVIGEPGVGKTVIVDGLAQKIVNGEVPESMQGKIILALDIGMMIAGCRLQGDFQERMMKVLDEIKKAKGDAFLFIDNINTIVGAGKAGGTDASGMLMPALNSGELHCIGTCSFDNHKKEFETNQSLDSLFQPIFLDEPTVDGTIEILNGQRSTFELHHGMRIKPSAIKAAAALSVRYLPQRRLPIKAIDLIDQTCAHQRILTDSKPQDLDKLEQELKRLQIERISLQKETDAESVKRLGWIDARLPVIDKEIIEHTARWEREKQALQEVRGLRAELDRAARDADQAQREIGARDGQERTLQVTKAAELADEVKALQAKLDALFAASDNVKNVRLLKEEIDANDVAGVIARWTGIPADKMLESDKKKLIRMSEQLGTRVIGQPEACAAVSSAVKRARAGLQDPNKPIGSFMFLGPTGVGKTELVKALAEFLFDDEHAMVRIDMSEYMEKASAIGLTGSRVGYVDSDKGGQLTEPVRRRPYQVVLFDEIEKAHPDVFNVLLQVLDDGRLTDGQGRTVDFRNTLIIMTSNLGSEDILTMLTAGAEYEAVRDKVKSLLLQKFRPELLNRVDECLVFRPLSEATIGLIVDKQLKSLSKLVTESNEGMTLEADQAAKNELRRQGYDPRMGARPLARVIQKKLKDPLADDILADKLVGGDHVKITWNPDGYFEFVPDRLAGKGGSDTATPATTPPERTPETAAGGAPVGEKPAVGETAKPEADASKTKASGK